MDKKKKKRKINKKKDKPETKSQPTIPHNGQSVDFPMKTPHNCKFPCRICKGDHLLKDCHGLALVLQEWSNISWKLMSSSSGHHADDTPSTSDSMVKIRKGKVKNPCLLCKDMHFTYLCPHMDEASKLLEDITVSRQRIPIGYR